MARLKPAGNVDLSKTPVDAEDSDLRRFIGEKRYHAGLKRVRVLHTGASARDVVAGITAAAKYTDFDKSKPLVENILSTASLAERLEPSDKQVLLDVLATHDFTHPIFAGMSPTPPEPALPAPPEEPAQQGPAALPAKIDRHMPRHKKQIPPLPADRHVDAEARSF